MANQNVVLVFSICIKAEPPSSFKQALRYCKRHKEQIQANALASRYSNMQAKQFWNDVSKSANRKATTYVNKIGNAVGEENICHMWHDYFKSLYNSVPDSHDRDYVVNACSEVNKDVFDYISVTDVANAIHGLKAAKSAGPNGLVSESFINSSMKLCIHLSLFYTLY